jgi:hypothetical protein
MSGPIEIAYGGHKIKSTTVGGEMITVTLGGEQDSPDETGLWRQPMGLRARPRDGQGDTLVCQDGDYLEVIMAWCPKLSLPSLAKGATQMYSTGSSPQTIELTDSSCKLGNNATEHIILGDKYKTEELKFLNALTTLSAALTAFCTAVSAVPVVGAAAATLKTATDTFIAATNTFKAALPDCLSTFSTTK